MYFSEGESGVIIEIDVDVLKEGGIHMSKNQNDPYSYDPYGSSFIVKAKQTVYKWWCVVYRPVYKLTHNGEWPAEKEPGYVPPQPGNDMANRMANEILSEAKQSKQKELDDMISSAKAQANKASVQQPDVQHTSAVSAPAGGKIEAWDDSVDTSGMSDESVDLAKQIMERLAREAAEDEQKKNAEIERARQEAAEREKLEQILRSNQVDISEFIEEGRARQSEHHEA